MHVQVDRDDDVTVTEEVNTACPPPHSLVSTADQLLEEERVESVSLCVTVPTTPLRKKVHVKVYHLVEKQNTSTHHY